MSFSTFSQFTDSVLLHRRFTLRRARHSSAAQLVSLEFTDGTYESIYLVAFILVGPVYHNALTDCAALSCRACVDLITCVAERYLTLRTGCEKRGRKNPLPFPIFEAVTYRQSAPDSPRERGDSQEGGNRRCLPSCAPARRQRNSPLRFSESLPARQGRTRLRSSCTRSAGAEKGCLTDRA